MKPIVTYLLCAALAAGNLFPARALHDCAMSGRRNMPRCCCQPAPAVVAEAACGACGSCDSVPRPNTGPRADAGGRTAGSDRTTPPSPEPSWAPPSTSRCCSVTYEKSLPAGLRPAPAAETETKQNLAARSLPPAVPSEAAALALPGHGWRNRNGPGRGAPFRAAPLFILHCSFLI